MDPFMMSKKNLKGVTTKVINKKERSIEKNVPEAVRILDNTEMAK